MSSQTWMYNQDIRRILSYQASQWPFTVFQWYNVTCPCYVIRNRAQTLLLKRFDDHPTIEIVLHQSTYDHWYVR